MTFQQEAISELLRKFPDAPSHTIAKIAFKHNPTLFPSIECARTCVRRLRGNSGDRMRRVVKSTEFRRPNGKSGFTYHLPKPERHFDYEWAPFCVNGPLRALIMSDVHSPYFDSDALKATFKAGREYKPNLVLLNGDFMDMYSISDFEKDPRKHDFKLEVETGKIVLATIGDVFPKARKIYKLGNHDERYITCMRKRSPEFIGIADFEFENVMGLKTMGWEVIGDKRPIRLGNLNVIHGHEYRTGRSCPVNPARTFFLKAKAHVLGGHFHQESQHSAKTVEIKGIGAWSTGCLCQLHPEYSPMNDWDHGFAMVTVEKDGRFHVDNKIIKNGKVW